MQIKDSGNRKEFNTGAVRDMHEGKGRYDLLPWDAVHELAQHCEEGAKKYRIFTKKDGEENEIS